MINITCFGCKKLFSFHNDQKEKNFCCPNCGEVSIVTNKKNEDVTSTDISHQEPNNIAVPLSPFELYQLKHKNKDKIETYFKPALLSILLSALLVLLATILIQNIFDNADSHFTAPENQKKTVSNSSLIKLKKDFIKIEDEKPVKTLVKNHRKSNHILTPKITGFINTVNNQGSLNQPKKTSTEKLSNVKKESANKTTPQAVKLIKLNVVNLTDKKLFIKMKPNTCTLLINAKNYPSYIEGEDYLLDSLQEIFIKLNQVKAKKLTLIYFGKEIGHQFNLNSDSNEVKLILKTGHQENREIIEFILMSNKTISGILHRFDLQEEKKTAKNPEKKIKEETKKLDKPEIKKEDKVVKVINVYNKNIQIKKYCSSCGNYYSGNYHNGCQTYLNHYSHHYPRLRIIHYHSTPYHHTNISPYYFYKTSHHHKGHHYGAHISGHGNFKLFGSTVKYHLNLR